MASAPQAGTHMTAGRTGAVPIDAPQAPSSARQSTCFGFGRDADFVPRTDAHGIIRYQFVSRTTKNPVGRRDANAHYCHLVGTPLSLLLCETKLGAVVRHFKPHSAFAEKRVGPRRELIWVFKNIYLLGVIHRVKPSAPGDTF
jgi:hypothetical protein